MAHSKSHKSQKKRTSKNSKSKSRKVLMEILAYLWVYVRMLIDYLVYLVFGWYYHEKSIKLPPVSKPFLMESATKIASKIRLRQLKAEDVVCAYIDRIKEVNSIINAVTDTRFEAAIEEAKKIDTNIDKIDFSKKPFLGVPFTTKESTSCAGMLWSFGLIARKDCRATEDADIVTLMKNAGAILIANTNIPELNLWQESRNQIYGQTCNPYDTTRTVGGSSGGEGSILAACGTAFGLSSDIGGSIRMPAFFCGTYGHKPTTYLISTKGLTKRTGKEHPSMVSAGPLCRYAEDLAPLLKVLLANNVNQLKLDKHVDITSLKYFCVEDSKDFRASPVCSELKQLMSKVVDHISNEILPEDNSVTRLDIPELRWSARMWRYWMTQEPSNFAKELANREGEVSALPELFKKLLGMSQHTIAAVFKLIDDTVLPKENEHFITELTEKLKEKLLAVLGDDGVLIYHSFAWPANYHYSALLQPYNFSYMSVFNVLHLPVTQIPLGLSSEGLPMGLQIVGAPYNDHLCIAVAKYLEKVFGGYVPPFQV